MNQRNKRQPFKIFYFIFILFGLSTLTIDPLIPVIAEELKVGYDKIGIAFFIGSIAVLVSTFIAGRLSDKFDIKKIIIFGIFLLVIGLLIFGLYLNYFVFIIVLVLIRGGFGAIDTSIHAYSSRFSPNNISRVFIILDIFWFLGASLGPILISVSLFLDIDPKFVFLFLSLAFAITLIILYKYCPSVKAGSKESARNTAFKKTWAKVMISIIKNPVVLLCCLVLFLNLGGTLGFSSWFTTYFLAFKISVALSSAFLSLYWFFSIAGLLIVNQLIKRLKEIDILLWGCSIGIVCLIFFIIVPNIYLKILFLSIQSLAFAGIFSLTTSIVVQEVPVDSGTVLGFVIAGAFSGTIVFQPIFGYVAEYKGEEMTVFVALAGVVLGLIAVFILFKLLKKKKFFQTKKRIA